eukprot:gnl/TRDRNA2_/TRDRNA2_151210_c3_seq1.p1 gnl/TRDRNA2_/TRDRNA2_151210_c3~~gnl/TRDRNA2_/TRDRNA2_151210_c3_seq1.p1  ORF type:complete len:153 (+),score=10.78 gnl/TRDRNA2_/TRDRNA2_151210_c3_seq1:3-461(+)
MSDRIGGRPVLILGLAAFVGGLALIRFELLSKLPDDDRSAPLPLTAAASSTAITIPPSALVAAALMGVGDATGNTVGLARLGTLSDDFGLLPRQTAFQFFQAGNMLMACTAFVYAPALPLSNSSTYGSVQLWLLFVLAVLSGLLVTSAEWKK